MEEKVLIKSVFDKKSRTIMLSIIGGLFAVSLMIVLLLAGMEVRHFSLYGVYWQSGLTSAVNGLLDFDLENPYTWMLIGAFLLFIFGIVGLIFFLGRRKCELTVTEKNVKGKTLFGKEVVLPIYMISAYSTRSFMSTISVATSSGLTKFALIGNYKEIGDVLSKMINDRQENTTKTEVKVEASSSNMDELVKLKSLLDQGIITQEEFEAKKKQLLGL